MLQKLLNRKSGVLEATGVLAVAYLISRCFGVVRDGILYAHLGAGDISDAYTAAFAVPDFIFNLLILGALSSAFIPVFVEYLKKDGADPEEAWGLVNTLVNFGVMLLAVVLLATAIFAPVLVHLVAPGFGPEKRDMVVDMMRVMLLAPLFFGFSNLAGGILNSFKNFLAFAIAPILYNIGIIFGIVVLMPKFGYMGLAYGVVLGAFLHMLIQLPGVFRLGYRYRLHFDIGHPAFRKMAVLMLPRTLGIGVSQINTVINGAVLASTLGIGSVTVWKAADDLLSLAVGVFGIPFAVAIFPTLAERYTLRQMSEFREDVVKTMRQVMFFIIPSMVLYWLLRAQVVRLIFGHGEFGWEATRFTVTVLAFMTFGLIAQALIPLLARSFYALQDTKTPLVTSLIALTVNVSLALWLIPQYKLVGLATALSIAGLVNLVLLLVLLSRRLQGMPWGELGRVGSRMILAALVMGGGGYLMLRVMDLIVSTNTTVGLALQTVVTLVVSVLIYLAGTKLLKLPEFGSLARPIHMLFGRR